MHPYIASKSLSWYITMVQVTCAIGGCGISMVAKSSNINDHIKNNYIDQSSTAAAPDISSFFVPQVHTASVLRPRKHNLRPRMLQQSCFFTWSVGHTVSGKLRARCSTPCLLRDLYNQIASLFAMVTYFLVF